MRRRPKLIAAVWKQVELFQAFMVATLYERP